MLPPQDKDAEVYLRVTAKALPYPPAPRLERARQLPNAAPRRGTLGILQGAGVLILVLGVLLMLTDFGRWIHVTATETPSTLGGFSGETTFAEALRLSGFDLRLPDEPLDLGVPDHVYYQDRSGAVVTLVWDVPGTNNVRFSLEVSASEAAPHVIGFSAQPQVVVNQQAAYWLPNPARDGGSHVLVWRNNDLTYRLGTQEPLETAVRVAESLEMVVRTPSREPSVVEWCTYQGKIICVG
jgi:hypothetical protein